MYSSQSFRGSKFMHHIVNSGKGSWLSHHVGWHHGRMCTKGRDNMGEERQEARKKQGVESWNKPATIKG